MRFKSIGFVGAMAATLVTMPGCSVEHLAKLDSSGELSFVTQPGECNDQDASDLVTSEMVGADCHIHFAGMGMLVGPLRDRINKELKDNDVEPDDADLSVELVRLDVRAARVEGGVFDAGDWDATLTVDGTSIGRVGGPTLQLGQTVSLTFPKTVLTKVEKALDANAPVMGGGTGNIVLRNYQPVEGDVTVTVQFSVHTEVLASVSIWAKVF